MARFTPPARSHSTPVFQYRLEFAVSLTIFLGRYVSRWQAPPICVVYCVVRIILSSTIAIPGSGLATLREFEDVTKVDVRSSDDHTIRSVAIPYNIASQFLYPISLGYTFDIQLNSLLALLLYCMGGPYNETVQRSKASLLTPIPTPVCFQQEHPLSKFPSYSIPTPYSIGPWHRSL